MNEYINPFNSSVNLDNVNEFLQDFLDSNCVNMVQFSFCEYDSSDGTGQGTRTTIEKTRYEVEEFV